jgi:molybdate/tungstate transport system substrate-binding protein
VLTTPGLTIGRTDPRLDPKGAYTIAAMTMLAGAEAERRILGADQNPAQTFPEEDLLVRIETGQADVGFFYEVEAKARGLNFLALPGAASMSDKVTYTLAVMQHAPHPATAATVRTFFLTGEGRRILTQAGLTYFAIPKALPITPCRPPCMSSLPSAVRQTNDAVGRISRQWSNSTPPSKRFTIARTTGRDSR